MKNVLRHPAADAEPVKNPPRRGRLPNNVTRLPLPAGSAQPRASIPAANGIAIIRAGSKPDVMVFSPKQALDLSMNLMRAQVECWRYMLEEFPDMFDDGASR
ncbi:hypothetical protein [Bordetella genomosp. 9]|uniref:hypothetical protein n=1 Tax=Bordetella genomosp. 9 TaxID=1416803 RepID=UPI001177732C|nr:hypothetical protein [Bordetella genomosp. 9]